jgi:alkylation response protein AidB-like acyl-CoA dehydrogenase
MREAAETSDQALEAEVCAWLAENWRPLHRPAASQGGAGWTTTPEHRAWLAKVVEARWAVPRWSPEWLGRGLSDAQAKIVERAFATVGAPGSGQDRTNLWANTALAYATPAFKARIVPALLKGDD